jgi:hypothetical protein
MKNPYDFRLTDFIPAIGIRNRLKREVDGMPAGISEEERELYYHECMKKDFVMMVYTVSWSVGTFTGLASLFCKN